MQIHHGTRDFFKAYFPKATLNKVTGEPKANGEWESQFTDFDLPPSKHRVF